MSKKPAACTTAQPVSFVNGTGARDTAPAGPAEVAQFEKPYLLLDVRDKDLYDTCHINGGAQIGIWLN